MDDREPIGASTPSSDPTGIAAVRALLGAKPRPIGWAQRRSRIEEVGAAWPAAADVRIEPVVHGGVACERSVAPGASDNGVLLFLHGGGYCSGSLVSHRTLATAAGRAAGVSALAVDYRRAPEHPFPAAVDDVLAVWGSLRAGGVSAERIAVAGDSAGAGLALALWQALRARGEAGPACLWLMSPWTDLTLSGRSLDDRDAVDPLLHRGYLDELAAAYTAGAVSRDDPRVSPLFARLDALPPVLVQVGTDEVLLDDALRFADAAARADAEVTLQVFPRMIHAFPLWHGALEAGRRAIADGGRFVQQHLA